jgi:hypothetical protein
MENGNGHAEETAEKSGLAESQARREMPWYQCHKLVHALKIKHIVSHIDGGAEITPQEEEYAGFVVDAEYMRKHVPSSGGYYVVYADGYKSFSPAEAFEQGYTTCERTDPPMCSITSLLCEASRRLTAEMETTPCNQTRAAQHAVKTALEVLDARNKNRVAAAKG